MLVSDPKVKATIASLKQCFEEIRQREVKRARGRLGALSSIQENAIDSLTHRIITRILDAPVGVLETSSEENDRLVVIETLHSFFSLREMSQRCSFTTL